MKRVLIISHNSLSLHSNNGKTLTSLFSDWGGGDLAQLYFQEEVPEAVKFRRFFRIRDLDFLQFLVGRKVGRKMEPVMHVNSHYESASWLKLRLLLLLRKLESVKRFSRNLIYGTGFWRSQDLWRWIEGLDPEVVFLVGGDYQFSFKVAEEVSKRYRIPLDIYITDDYVLNAAPRGILPLWLHCRLMATYRRIFAFARNVFVIGEDMASAFGKAFERDFVPVMNAVSLPQDIPNRSYELGRPGKVDIVYAGGLHLGRDEALLQFGELIRDVAHDLDLNIQLTVYSLTQPKTRMIAALSACGVSFGGSLPHDSVMLHLEEADFVLHVESFEKEHVSKTKLSVSTKIPEYFASGTCLVAFGPAEVASMKVISRAGAGIVLTEDDSLDQRKRKLASAIQSAQYRESTARRAFDYAKVEFDGDIVRRKFSDLVNQ